MAHEETPYYFITVTYKSSEKLPYYPKQQFQSTIVPLVKALRKAADEYYVSPEFTIKGAIHYHILAQIKDKINWYQHFVPFLKRQGFFDIQYCKSFQNTYEYITKDTAVVGKLIGFSDLPITEGDYKSLKKYISKTHIEFHITETTLDRFKSD